jgi:hypothetical protein
MKRLTFALFGLLLLALVAVPASAGVVWDNTNSFINNFNVDAWTINSGFAVADSFTFGSNTNVQGVDFWVWEFAPPTGGHADDMTQVDWAIVNNDGGGNPFAGSTIDSGTVSTSGLFAGTNGFGYDVYEESFATGGVALGAGTYWLILQNAVSSSGNLIYWDQSDGPSAAYENTIGDLTNCGGTSDSPDAPGTTCSETFDLTGTSDVTTPEPGSLMLFGSGMLLLAGALRRKASR